MGKHDSAELILKLYDLRREETMRKARNWIFGFNPTSAEDYWNTMMDPEVGGYLRMVTSYWDMAASFAMTLAPLLLVWLPQEAAVLACAWIVAFFPVLANTTLGLNSIDYNLADLFRLYGASRGQVLWRLKLPSALPQMLAGLKIAGGLSLIGAVVAEIAAGSAGAGSGLAYRIAESGYRLNIPRMFAALLLLSVAGIVIFVLLSAFSHLMLRRWHESAVSREG
jgi:ABC-type nitrate/sulfonate/bicarbonate transport system permease component